MLTYIRSSAFAVCILCHAGLAHSVPIIHHSNGVVSSISGLSVADSLYTATFSGGIYDRGSDLYSPIGTQPSAIVLRNALHTYLSPESLRYTNSPTAGSPSFGLYGFAGCVTASHCALSTAFAEIGTQHSIHSVILNASGGLTNATFNNIPAIVYTDISYISWSTIASVPAPAIFEIMMLGLLGIGFSRRKTLQ